MFLRDELGTWKQQGTKLVGADSIDSCMVSFLVEAKKTRETKGVLNIPERIERTKSLTLLRVIECQHPPFNRRVSCVKKAPVPVVSIHRV